MTAVMGRWLDPGVLPPANTWQLFGATDKKDATARANQARSVALDEIMLSPTVRTFAKPSAAAKSASAAEAAQALGRVTSGLNDQQPAANRVNLSDLSKMPMDSLMMATTLLVANGLGKVAESKGKALHIITGEQERARDLEVKKIQEQMDEAIKQQQQAKKSGIFGAIFSWVIAAVEVVSGVAKMAVGAVTGNVSMAAGGAMDFLAGAAGVVKAVAETMAVVDPDNAEKYKAIAEKAGHVQLAFEIAGAVVDVTSAISYALITKVVPSVTKEVLKEGAEKVLVEAVKSGSKDAVAASAKAIGKEVAAKVAGDIAEQLGKTALDASKNTVAKELAKTIGVRQLMEAFSREAIEEMVTKTVQKVATEAMESGGEITAKALTKKITRELTYEVTKAVMKASAFTALNVVRGATGGASKVVSGVIEIERAKLQKQIELLMLDQQWLQILLDEFEQRKKETVEKTKELIDGQANAVQGGSDALKQTYGTKIQGVASLARVATATA